jgi:two-component system, cell cycle sensor histidine kinase and response regulator CckA
MLMEPGMDGLETYKKVLELHPGQKALITTGFSETARVKETLMLGAGGYLKKPYLLDQIGLAVRTELNKRPRNQSEPSGSLN